MVANHITSLRMGEEYMEVYEAYDNCEDFEEMRLVMSLTVLKMLYCLKKANVGRVRSTMMSVVVVKVLGDSEMRRKFILYCLIMLSKCV